MGPMPLYNRSLSTRTCEYYLVHEYECKQKSANVAVLRINSCRCLAILSLTD